MPIQFSCTTSYLGKEVTVTSDDFKQLHEAVAKLDELNQDANFLAKKSGSKQLSPDYRTDADHNEYYGVSVKGKSRESVTFGQLREGGLVPFFPKGEEGYYDGERRHGGGGQRQQRRPQNGQRQGGGQQRGGGQQQQRQPAQPQQQRQQQPAGQPQGGGQGGQDDGLPF